MHETKVFKLVSGLHMSQSRLVVRTCDMAYRSDNLPHLHNPRPPGWSPFFAKDADSRTRDNQGSYIALVAIT